MQVGRSRKKLETVVATWAAALMVTAGAGAVLLPSLPARASEAPLRVPLEPATLTTEQAIERANAAVEQILAVPRGERTFENTIQAIDDLLAQLELDTNMTMFMAYVSTDAAERERGQQAEQAIQNWLVDFSKREDLYQAVRDFAATDPSLTGEDARLLEFMLRDYRRAGMELSDEQRSKLAEVQKEINRLSIEFEKNIRVDDTRLIFTREELAGLPEDFFKMFEPGQTRLGREGELFAIGLSYPEFYPIMEYAEHEDTRQKLWFAYKRKGGEQNVQVLEDILALRNEAAELLGYEHPADYEIEVRMAKDAQTVREFYEKIRPLARVKALQDHAQLEAAKREHVGDPEAVLEPWDYWFYKGRIMKDRFAVDSELVRQYFPLDRVTEGLFSITQSLYGIEYEDVTDQAGSMDLPVWHEDVSLYAVTDTKTDELLGHFYIDLHPRESKYSHAAQWGLAQHKVWADGQITRPLAALVCNFTKPTDDKPSLMSHDEVETYFHEFGHCLHTILSEAEHWRFAGTGVERDFVEAPSQMFENWVWDADVLRTFARHYETNEPFPDALLEGMLAARYFGSGMDAERQFYYGLVDLTYHTDDDGELNTTKVGLELAEDVELYHAQPGSYFQAGFGHLTGYQAGYYGYMWSLVYACDMFQRFEELGMLDPEAGMYYRKKILAPGGTKDGLELVREYLGREPDMDAFLKHLGLDPKEAAAKPKQSARSGG